MTNTATDRVYDAIDLSRSELWAGPSEEREAAFAELRRDRPVTWQRPIRSPLMDAMGQTNPPGYWAVTRLEDIVTVSRNAAARKRLALAWSARKPLVSFPSA